METLRVDSMRRERGSHAHASERVRACNTEVGEDDTADGIFARERSPAVDRSARASGGAPFAFAFAFAVSVSLSVSVAFADA